MIRVSLGYRAFGRARNTTQNLVVKFDGEICGGVLVEDASDDFPQQKKLENLLPNFAGSSPPVSPKTSPTSLWKSLVLRKRAYRTRLDRKSRDNGPLRWKMRAFEILSETPDIHQTIHPVVLQRVNRWTAQEICIMTEGLPSESCQKIVHKHLQGQILDIFEPLFCIFSVTR